MSPVNQHHQMFYGPLISQEEEELGAHNLSTRKEAPESFKSAYPKFMEPHKHYPYRRLNDTHVEKVMQDAVRRIDEDLKNQEQRRINQSKEFQDRFDMMLKQAESSNLMKMKDAMSLKEYHMLQMQEKSKINSFYNSEDKKPQDIYYGPSEKDFKDLNKTYAGAKTRADAEKMRKNDLKKQIDTKRRIESIRKQRERMEDVENLWVSGQFMAKERQELLEKDKISKSMYNHIWKEQMKINQKLNKNKADGFLKI